MIKDFFKMAVIKTLITSVGTSHSFPFVCVFFRNKELREYILKFLILPTLLLLQSLRLLLYVIIFLISQSAQNATLLPQWPLSSLAIFDCYHAYENIDKNRKIDYINFCEFIIFVDVLVRIWKIF